jgi:hypothetical protein
MQKNFCKAEGQRRSAEKRRRSRRQLEGNSDFFTSLLGNALLFVDDSIRRCFLPRRVDLHRLWMHRFNEDLPRIMKVTPSRRRAVITFLTGADQPAMQVNGIEISSNQIASIALDWEWYLQSSTPCEWGTMSLAPEDLAAVGETITGRELAPPAFARGLRPMPHAPLRMRKLHEASSHLARTAPDILAEPEVAQAIEQALVEAMVFCLADGQSQDVRSVQRNRARVMGRMEEVLMANPDEPLYMAELAARPTGHCVTAAWSIWA